MATLGLLSSLALATTTAAATALYFFKVAQKPVIYYSKKHEALVHACQSLHETLYPTFYLLNPHLSTIVTSKMRRHVPISFQREIFPLSDGGELGLDWALSAMPPESTRTPIFLILHGITGSSDDNYVKLLVQCIQREHYGAVVMNARGRGGLKLKTPRGYSAAFTDDLREVVMHIRSKYPHNPLFAVGVSLGSIILVKYLDEYKEACGLNAAVNYVHENYDIFKNHPESAFDPDLLTHVKRISHFDEAVILPSFGYSTLKEYHDDASSVNHLSGVSIPLLFINAADDPFAPLHTLPVEKFTTNENVIVALVQYGGHVAFPEGIMPTGEGWHDRVVVDFCQSVLKLA